MKGKVSVLFFLPFFFLPTVLQQLIPFVADLEITYLDPLFFFSFLTLCAAVEKSIKAARPPFFLLFSFLSLSHCASAIAKREQMESHTERAGSLPSPASLMSPSIYRFNNNKLLFFYSLFFPPLF